jgi:flagellar basal-body rod modification protein FlgD
MATIGRPENINNPFSNISMRPAEPKQQVTQAVIDPKTGETLNKIVGVKPEQRFVDRKSHDQLGPDGFMKLLAHQLKNQDPLKPMDQKDFSANLAQFSQLEQMTAMNKKMDAFSQNAVADKKFQGASYLGKKVVTSGTTIDCKGDGKDMELPFFLDKPAKNLIIHIYDNKNQMIGKVEKEEVGKGMQAVNWDGIGLDNQLAPKETYHFDVVAFDDQNQKFFGTTRSEGTVTGVNFENGETIFTVAGGRKVYLRDVESFSLPEGNKPNSIDGKNIPALQKQVKNTYNQLEN